MPLSYTKIFSCRAQHFSSARASPKSENRLPGGPDCKPIPHFDRRVELSSNLRSVTDFIHKFPRYDFSEFLCTL